MYATTHMRDPGKREGELQSREHPSLLASRDPAVSSSQRMHELRAPHYSAQDLDRDIDICLSQWWTLHETSGLVGLALGWFVVLFVPEVVVVCSAAEKAQLKFGTRVTSALSEASPWVVACTVVTVIRSQLQPLLPPSPYHTTVGSHCNNLCAYLDPALH